MVMSTKIGFVKKKNEGIVIWRWWILKSCEFTVWHYTLWLLLLFFFEIFFYFFDIFLNFFFESSVLRQLWLARTSRRWLKKLRWILFAFVWLSPHFLCSRGQYGKLQGHLSYSMKSSRVYCTCRTYMHIMHCTVHGIDDQSKNWTENLLWLFFKWLLMTCFI